MSDWLTWEVYEHPHLPGRGPRGMAKPRGEVALGKLPGLTVSPGGRWIVKGGRGDKELIVRDGLTTESLVRWWCRKVSAIGEILFDQADEAAGSWSGPTGLAVSWVVGKHGFVSPAKPADRRQRSPTFARPRRRGSPSGPSRPSTNTPSRAWHGKAPAHVSDAHEPPGRRSSSLGYSDATNTYRVWVGRTATGEHERRLDGATKTVFRCVVA